MTWPIEMVLEGPPRTWQAPRVTRKGAFSLNYQQKQADRWHIATQAKEYIFLPLKEAVMIMLLFEMPLPGSTSKKMRQKMLNGEVQHVKKFDLDNMCKYTIDLLKKIVIADDNQVFDLKASKVYSENPKTIIRLYAPHIMGWE
jgi:Holliday junction resolvase RusA-like endonuclease